MLETNANVIKEIVAKAKSFEVLDFLESQKGVASLQDGGRLSRLRFLLECLLNSLPMGVIVMYPMDDLILSNLNY